MAVPMSYSYSDSALRPSLDEIRLLRLLPNKDEDAPLRSQLFKCILQDSGRRTHPYDALSYVWGDSANPKSIFIGKHTLSVTVNLHKALSRLRHHSIERILWVDAICINQEDTSEKEQQIQIMATIYALASLVVVWIGDAAENSDEALEEICHLARYKNSSNSPRPECTQENAVLALLLRRWFRRIWVLQEVAAARHILVMCGSMEIDGYAFCLGVRSYDFMNSNPQLQGLINSVIYLIEGAIFRRGFVTTSSGRSSLDISTLGELMDMYHTHEATEHHDKIYALLGMSIDDLSKAGLSPDYGLPWEDLFRNLVKFLLHDDVSVEILAPNETALIKSQGCILGWVGSVQREMPGVDSPGFYLFIDDAGVLRNWREGEADNQWIPHASAKTVRDGDLICLLQGASNPSIVRPHDGYFNVILIVAPPVKDLYESFQLTLTRQCNLTLLWDWGKLPLESEDLAQDERLFQTGLLKSEVSKVVVESRLDEATRRINFAMAINNRNMDLDERAQDQLQKAMKGYERTAAEGDELLVKELIEMGEVHDDFEQEQNLMLWIAAHGGHKTMVKLLLGTGKIDVNAIHRRHGTTPLLVAARMGHIAVVDLLLQGKANKNAVERFSNRTVLQVAAQEGHLAIVERLLQEKVEVNAADIKKPGYRTALQAAAEGGHLTIVHRLLQKEAEVNAPPAVFSGRTALQAAAEGGYLAVVERLLQGNADVNAVAGTQNGCTALQAAAEGGHLAIVERLLQENADVSARGAWGRTALHSAARAGHPVVVKRLLQANSGVNAMTETSGSLTPLQVAAKEGHLDVVEELLQGGADINATGKIYNKTALYIAAKSGHLAVVERLFQQHTDIDILSGACNGHMILAGAEKGGSLTVIEFIRGHLSKLGVDI